MGTTLPAVPLPRLGRWGGRQPGPCPQDIELRPLPYTPVVSEQSDAYRVTFYCDCCAQRWGRGPVLAIADRGSDWPEGCWWLQVARRRSRPISPEQARAESVRSYSGGAVPDRPNRFKPKPGRFQLVPLNTFGISAAGLVCPKCKARPRVAVAKLVELAEQAMAASRHDAYT
jgi:hypothetical protein